MFQLEILSLLVDTTAKGLQFSFFTNLVNFASYESNFIFMLYRMQASVKSLYFFDFKVAQSD